MLDAELDPVMPPPKSVHGGSPNAEKGNTNAKPAVTPRLMHDVESNGKP